VADVTLSSNTAVGGDWGKYSGQGSLGEGGGLFVGYATATLTNVTLSSNDAKGGTGKTAGGGAYGGALATENTSTVALTNCTLSFNSAVGGDASSGTPGSAYGGAIVLACGVNYTEPAQLTLRDDTITGNTAQGGKSGSVIGSAYGGGLYVWGGTPTLTSTPSRSIIPPATSRTISTGRTL
jgi:hypothetical protein